MIGVMQAVDAQTKPNPLTTGKAKPPAETIKVTPVTKPVATVKGRIPDLSVTLNRCNYKRCFKNFRFEIAVFRCK